MHVIRIRDQQGTKRIFAAKFVKRTDESVTFIVSGQELTVRNDDLIEMIKVNDEHEWDADFTPTQDPSKN